MESIGQDKRTAFAQSFLGQEVEVCIERDGAGWTAEYLKCAIKDLKNLKDFKDLKAAEGPLPRRSLVKAQVVRVEGDRLVAVPSAL